jgi:hypothetical protein
MWRRQGPLDKVEVLAQVGADVVEGVGTVNRTGIGAGVEGALGIAFSGGRRRADFGQGFAEPWACADEV